MGLRLRISALTLVDGLAVVGLRPDLAAVADGLTAPRHWLAHAGADRVVAVLAGLGGWLAATWVALGLLAAALSRLPGTAGRLAAATARVALPALVRRLLAGSAGLGVLLAPATAAVATPGTGPGPAGPAWPTTPSVSAPGPAWPTGGEAPVTPDHHPPRPEHRPQPRDGHPGTHAAAARVTVRAGDCLWLLGSRRLGADASDARVARYVARLHAVNRDVIGADPDHITPGQVLALPPPPQESP
ncbi:hypothetical protein SAMN05443575_1038 [Jatrophihabitans endophyticus]|uniref:LysM domain-containing protein n=1 Tax=Jatrophihabitans endophyticus TaxID=1206085 RepID=A0A1M5EXM9_9ACTN|nr:hypothetical protein [Jatrophihabitans endophyticus]SHF83948.1 hypothetical protein SAMN05443575_1038 [Jatrophihabitans endophyticus]